jgi:hypothetical protein
VPDNIALVLQFRLMNGEEVSVLSDDFSGRHEAIEAVARALDEHRSLVLTHAKRDRHAYEEGVVVNLANVVSARVSTSDSAAAGQYL